MKYLINYCCISHIGKIRSVNQDNFICNGKYMKLNVPEIDFPLKGKVTTETPSLFGVFDGMGGEECGEIASCICALESAELQLNGDGYAILSDFCQNANNRICQYAESNSVSTMGTTAGMLLCGENNIFLCNIGDSRIFILSGGEMNQISVDHLTMAIPGRKPSLSQNLGIPPTEMIIEPHFSFGYYNDGDKYLICSDGLTDMVPPEEIKTILDTNSPEKATKKLVNKALENGGRDNITVIVLEIRNSKN